MWTVNRVCARQQDGLVCPSAQSPTTCLTPSLQAEKLQGEEAELNLWDAPFLLDTYCVLNSSPCTQNCGPDHD